MSALSKSPWVRFPEGLYGSLMGATALAAWALVLFSTNDTLRLNDQQFKRYGEGSWIIIGLFSLCALHASLVAWWLYKRMRKRLLGASMSAWVSLLIFVVSISLLCLLAGLINMLSAAFFGVMS